MFGKSKWIWINRENNTDEYADFLVEFDYDGGDVMLNLSADGNFSININGELCGVGQYPDYPFYKVVEKRTITNYLVQGKNRIIITVFHSGLTDSQTYYPAEAGLIFELVKGDKVISISDENTCSRLNPNYLSYYKKKVTPQLGYSYLYDSTKGETAFTKSVIVDKKCTFVPRPIKDLTLSESHLGTINKADNGYMVAFDKETVGYFEFDFYSDKEQKITVSYGEHLVDNEPPRFIGIRDFSFEYVAKKGHNHFENRFLRLAGRYIKIFASDIKLNYVKLNSYDYELKLNKYSFDNEQDKLIYETAIHTLKCCMHDHYEDCPWREQALYAMDSRNQMLCGYYAFSEYKFPRANLVLLANSVREDGLLDICAPNGLNFPIPFFSLAFILAVYEYVEYSKDKTILDEVMAVSDGIIKAFIGRIDDTCLVSDFPEPFWNFYEWADYDEKNLVDSPCKHDLILNCMFIYVCELYNKLKGKSLYNDEISAIKKAVKDRLYDESMGLYLMSDKERQFTLLGNSLAVLCGLEGKDFADKLISKENMVDVTLSMKGFYYDALIKAGVDKDIIIDEIRKDYNFMLDNGATTFWETIKGWRDFDNAGSLCHGWSAIPVYYFNILGLNRQ